MEQTIEMEKTRTGLRVPINIGISTVIFLQMLRKD